MWPPLRHARQAVTLRAMSPEIADPKVAAEVERQVAILSRGVDEILPMDEFRKKLARSIAENRPLRVKQGFDPTAPDIHLGHTVGLRKLRAFPAC